MAGAKASRIRPSVIGALYVGTPLASLLVFPTPVLATGIAAAAVLGMAAVAIPTAFLAAVAFLSTAVPKAGFVVNGLPLPLMMFVLLGGATLLRWRAGPAPRRGSRMAVLAVLWLVYRLVDLSLNGGGVRDLAGLAGWYGLPLALLLLGPPIGGLRRPLSDVWTRSLEAGILFACGFSVVQQLGGIEQTAVPGITRAVGADYSAKPLQFEGGSKIPSTYQNGNILGVITAVFFVISAEQVLRGRGTRRDLVIMAATAIATLLSGSRTAVIGLGLALFVLMLRSGLRRQTITIAGLGIAVAGATLYLSPALARRLLNTTASDPALAQRTELWSHVLETISPIELLVGGPAWAHPEVPGAVADGLIGGVQQVGLIGMGLFLGMFVVSTSPPHLRRWRLLLLPVLVSFAADSAYLVFPTLFLPIARMFAPLEPLTSEPEEASIERPGVAEVTASSPTAR